MMDQERTNKEIEEVQRSYKKLVEEALALQEQTLEVARGLLEESSAEVQAQSTRNTLESLAKQSESQREVLEALLRSSTDAFATVLKAPYAHHQKVDQAKEVLEEARADPQTARPQAKGWRKRRT